MASSTLSTQVSFGSASVSRLESVNWYRSSLPDAAFPATLLDRGMVLIGGFNIADAKSARQSAKYRFFG